MRSLRRTIPALAAVIMAGVVALSGMSPAAAAPPYPTGSQATALVGGTPLVQASCPTLVPAVSPNTTSTSGAVSVSSAGAQCSGNAAQTGGSFTVTGGLTGSFGAQCANSGGTNGSVTVNGTQYTTTQTVTFPNGSTAILNEVITTDTSVTRNAIRIISGPGAGTIIGQVICGVPPYSLAVGASAGAASADIAPIASSNDGGFSSRTLIIGAAVAMLLAMQVVAGRSLVRRRRGHTAG